MKIQFNIKRLPHELNSVEFDNFLILMNMSFDGYFSHTIDRRVNNEFSNQINVEFSCLLYFDDCHLSVSGIFYYSMCCLFF